MRLTPVSDGATTVQVRVVDGMTSPRKARMAGPTDNCAFDAPTGLFQCKNVDPENVFNRGSYVLFRKLDAWGGQKVRVKNTSGVPVSAYVAQGFNVTSKPVRLEPGQSTVLSRIDGGWAVYNALVKPEASVDAGAMTIEAQLLE